MTIHRVRLAGVTLYLFGPLPVGVWALLRTVGQGEIVPLTVKAFLSEIWTSSVIHSPQDLDLDWAYSPDCATPNPADR